MHASSVATRRLPATALPQVSAVPQVAGLAPSGPASAWRRRLTAIILLCAFAFALTVAIGRVTAGAELADPVAGHVVVQPGQSLWEVAAQTSPSGGDTRDQLARIVELNGLTSHHIHAWSVLLLPAR